MELLKIFAQNLHIYHKNDSISACIIYFIYILVLEDVIGSDAGGGFFGPHCIYISCFGPCYMMLAAHQYLSTRNISHNISVVTIDIKIVI